MLPGLPTPLEAPSPGVSIYSNSSAKESTKKHAWKKADPFHSCKISPNTIDSKEFGLTFVNH